MDRGTYGFRKPQKKEGPKEEFAIVLDVIEGSHSFNDSKVVQAIGFDSYSLLELVPKAGVEIKSGDKVYIGEGKRDEIQYIKRVLFFDKLSGTSESELIYVLMDIIEEKEEFFVNFFNKAGPISLRRHSLEIIPSVGKKHFKDIIAEREVKAFESFADIKARLGFMPDPVKSLAERILSEIKGEAEHNFFVRK